MRLPPSLAIGAVPLPNVDGSLLRSKVVDPSDAAKLSAEVGVEPRMINRTSLISFDGQSMVESGLSTKSLLADETGCVYRGWPAKTSLKARERARRTTRADVHRNGVRIYDFPYRSRSKPRVPKEAHDCCAVTVIRAHQRSAHGGQAPSALPLRSSVK